MLLKKYQELFNFLKRNLNEQVLKWSQGTDQLTVRICIYYLE